jgi:dTDP-L-rhamnose 4-epimerase
MNAGPGVVLVTGGAGFIGTALSRRLASLADRWVAVDSMHPQVHPTAERPAALADAAELIVGDVSEPEVWDAVLADVRPDVVIHLAAETGTAQSLHEASRHSIANVVGTTRMTDAFGRVGHVPGHVILSSSRAVYGEGSWRRPDGSEFRPGQRSHAQLEGGQWDFPGAVPVPSSFERTEPAPSSIYASTKLAQEHILRNWSASVGVPLTVLRLQNVYGAGQSLINPYTGIVSLFSQLAREGQSIPLYEDGRITRDFVVIHDVVEAFGAAIAAVPAVTRGLDVGSGVETTIEQLAREIAAYHSAPEPHITGAYRDGDVRYAACDISRTQQELGWSPQWSLSRGIADLQDWIAQQT